MDQDHRSSNLLPLRPVCIQSKVSPVSSCFTPRMIKPVISAYRFSFACATACAACAASACAVRLAVPEALIALPGTLGLAFPDLTAASLVERVLISASASDKELFRVSMLPSRFSALTSLASSCFRSSSPSFARAVCAASSALSSDISCVAAVGVSTMHDAEEFLDETYRLFALQLVS